MCDARLMLSLSLSLCSGGSASVGASGSIFGLLGCELILIIQTWKLLERPKVELAKVVFSIVSSLLLGLLPGIDNFAHIGGLLCGIVATLVFLPTIDFGRWDRWGKRASRVVGLVLAVIVLAVGIPQFYSGKDPSEVCGWCKYLSCLPAFDACRVQ